MPKSTAKVRFNSANPLQKIMREFLKNIYRLKIKAMFYFNLGWGEVATPIAVTRDIGVTLAVINFLFKVNFGLKKDILICLATFAFGIILGLILKFSGMSDYANKLSNGINPEIKLINKIAEKLGIDTKNI